MRSPLLCEATEQRTRLRSSFATPGEITFSEPSFEANILKVFAGVLTEVDHQERMERFLSRESWDSSLRVAAYAGENHILLARARIAVAQNATDAQSALEAVPESLRSETSYLLAKVQLLRKQEKPDEAWPILATVAPAVPSASADGDQWWFERRLIARKLLDRGDAYSAYAIVRDNVAEFVEKRIEAEIARRLDRAPLSELSGDSGASLLECGTNCN